MLTGEKEIRSSFFYIRFEKCKLQDSRKEDEHRTFHKLHVLGMNEDWRDGVLPDAWME